MDLAVEQPLSRPASGYGEFRRGWQVVLASLLGIGLGLSPLPIYTMGMFAPHLAQEFGWSMGQIMGGISVTTLMVLWAGPAVGILAERLGVRRVAMTSLVLFGFAFMSLSLSTGSLVQYYVSWAAIAILGAGTLPITWTKAVNHWFDRRKGLALGLSLMGTGLFGVFSKPYVGWLIDHFGWRGAYVGLGILPLLIALPVAWFLFRDTDEHPDALVRTTTPGGLTLPQAFRDRRFWMLTVALLPISFALGGPVPNMELILTSNGITADKVLVLTPIIGLSALIGRVVGGWLLDRFWAPAVAFVILSLPALSCWLLTIDGLSFGMAASAIFLIGFALGIEYDVMAFFVARYFGLRSYASIYGILYLFFAIGTGFGPLAFGWDYDAHGSYDLVLKTSFVMLLLAAASFLLMGRYRVFADEPILN